MVIGIVGTAKNTGKTTTVNCLLGEAARRSLAVAVTGIGYDGEEIDTITLLPKPRIIIQQGSIAATSERCLTGKQEQIQILERTGMFTPLGEVIIFRAVQTGMIVIAGPNKRSDLNRLLAMLRRYQPEMIIVDGALNRIAPMSIVDKVIVTTGGARSEKIDELKDEVHAVESFFRCPVCTDTLEPGMSVPFLADEHDVHVLLYRSFGPGEMLEVTGPVSLKGMEFLARLLESHRYPFNTLVLADPFTLLMAGDSIRMKQVFERILKSGITVKVREAPALSFVTANPFVPRFNGMTYSSAFLNAAELVNALRTSCAIPVYDTALTPSAEILDSCLH